MYPLDVTQVVMRRWRAGVRGRDRSSDRYRCGGTGLPQASGLFASLSITRAVARLFFFLFFWWKKESLHAHRCQSYKQFERQIKQTTEECRVHSTSYDKGSCFAMA